MTWRRIRQLKRRLSNSWIGRLVIGVWQRIENLPDSTAFWLALVAIMLLGSILGLAFWGWDWLRVTELNLLPESKSTTIRNAGLVIAGALALVFAVWRGVLGQRQAKIAQQGLSNERYQKGAEMLGSEVLAVRLGGIYALQRLAAEHPEQYHIQIMQLFCAYVRNPTGDEQGPVSGSDEDGKPIHKLREGVQAAMYAIGKRTDACIAIEKAAFFLLDLRNANLQHSRLSNLNLSYALLGKSNMFGASLYISNLSSASLTDANLSDTDLTGVNLSDANLYRAKLSNAVLNDTNLSDANLYRANLSNAVLIRANLSNASLPSANLSKTRSRNSDLSHARLAGANLTGANLIDDNLTGSSFSRDREVGGSRIPARGLTQAQLNKAWSEPDNPPDLEGVCDAETGEQLVWSGNPVDDDP